MSIIDFPIERINEFLSNHSFVVTKPLGEGIEVDGHLTVKVKLTGIKPMISVGDWKDFIEYTIILEEIDDSHLKSIFSYMFASVKTQDYVISNNDTKFYTNTSQVNQLLRNFLKYWGTLCFLSGLFTFGRRYTNGDLGNRIAFRMRNKIY